MKTNTIENNVALDELAQHIILMLAERGLDPHYIAIDWQQNRLAGRDRLGVLAACRELDGANRSALADRLGIARSDLDGAIRVADRLRRL